MAGGSSPFHSVDLVVWSGTGNTRHVAERIADAARIRGAEARVRVAGSAHDSVPPGRTLLGLLAPTHGFTAPWPIIKSALTIPHVRGVDAFVLVTRGGTRIAGRSLPGFEGTAAYLPAALLALRGARVRGVGAIDMPLNWTVVVPAAKPDDVSRIVAAADVATDAFASQILGGGKAFGGLSQLIVGILMLPLSLGYMLIARLLLAKMFFADDRCTSCGTCERNCPHGAVWLREEARRPYWGFRCQNCMRCMSNCPNDAIQGGQAWLLLYVWLVTMPTGILVTTAVMGAFGLWGGAASSVVGLVSSYLWIMISVWTAYAALWLGLLVPRLGPLLAKTTLTPRYRRYRGPDSSR
jgi:ferredoxin